MMKFPSRLHKQRRHESLFWRDSTLLEGVKFRIRRISLSQRIELTRRARELSLKHEFLKAGDTADELEGALSDLLVRKLYLEWGLDELAGLTIDGDAATVELLIDKGPEALSDEILAAIRAELGLSDDERKNY